MQACGWQPVDAMVLAPGVRELILHAVQLWDELATGWGGVPVYDGVAERLAAMLVASGAHLRELTLRGPVRTFERCLNTLF